MKSSSLGSAAAIRGCGSHGFTLMELVAVIAIIAVLVAMLLPTISKVKSYTRKVGARAEAKSIEAALKQYYTEYQRWPALVNSETNAYPITDDLALILQGGNPTNTVPAPNPKQLQFMQFSRLDGNNDPINPWRERAADPYYYARFDCNFDKNIDGTGTYSPPPSNTVRTSVIVWTVNPDANPGDNDYIIGTWQQ